MTDTPDRRNAIRNAWKGWFRRFVPAFVGMMIVMHFFGFGATMTLALAVLAATLAYQRLVNGRSWRSILWGVHAPPR